MLGGAVCVCEGLDRDHVAVVAEPQASLRHPGARSDDVGAVRHVDVAALAPRFLDWRPKVGHERVAALDERQRFFARCRVVTILPHSAQVVLPGCGYRAPQANDAWLHRSFPFEPN